MRSRKNRNNRWWLIVPAIVLLSLGSCSVAGRVYDARFAFLTSPEGQRFIQEEIAFKIYERHGEEARYAYEEGTAIFPGAVNDVMLSALFGPPVLTFLLIWLFGLGVLGVVWEKVCSR